MDTEETIETPNPTPVIRHLVIPGGGVTGYSYYGALSASARLGIWHMDNIETMYGTSVGAILIVMFALKYSWEILDDFLIKRPWQNVFKFDMNSVMMSIQKRGIFEQKLVEDLFLPLFSGKDIPIDITMADFYELTKIDLHIFTTEISTFTTVEISYHTHPDWKVVEAVYASCSLPIIFAPMYKNEMFYCDGGFLANYPVKQCIQNGADPKEILGILRVHIENKEQELSNSSTLLDYALLLMNKTVNNIVFVDTANNNIGIEYTVPSRTSSIYSIYTAAVSIDERIHLIDVGKNVIHELHPIST